LAQALVALKFTAPEDFTGFDIVGVIQDVLVEDSELQSFSKSSLPGHTIYYDRTKSFYEALGNRKWWKLVPWYSCKSWSSFNEIVKTQAPYKQRRSAKKSKIEMSALRGGIIVYDAKGVPKYSFPEDTYDGDYPLVEMLNAVRAVGQEHDLSGTN